MMYTFSERSVYFFAVAAAVPFVAEFLSRQNRDSGIAIFLLHGISKVHCLSVHLKYF